MSLVLFIAISSVVFAIKRSKSHQNEIIHSCESADRNIVYDNVKDKTGKRICNAIPEQKVAYSNEQQEIAREHNEAYCTITETANDAGERIYDALLDQGEYYYEQQELDMVQNEDYGAAAETIHAEMCEEIEM